MFRRMAAPTDVDLACEGLQAIKKQLKKLVGDGQATSSQLTAAADDCADAVIITTNAAEIRMVNGAAARLTGISTRELQTQTLWDVTHATSQADFDVLWKEFLRSSRQRGGFSLRHRDGEPVAVAYCAEANVLPELHVFVLRKVVDVR
jgi:PAS domain S-box-containing protein